MENDPDVPEDRNAAAYPEPKIIRPKLEHRQTIILLHGRGDNGPAFGTILLMTPVPNYEDLQTAFPHAKFVFPTAARRRAAVLRRTPVHQWFDLWDIKNQTEKEHLQYEGLRETTEVVHRILREEIAIIGAKNVMLGGLSQGCASSLIAMILWDGEPLAAWAGFCGWLPLAKHLREIMRDEGEADAAAGVTLESDSAREETAGDKVTEACNLLREKLELEPVQRTSTAFQHTPMFFGHGVLDKKVPISLGVDAASCMRSLGASTEWRDYELLEHWYSPNMLLDVVEFLKSKTNWTTGEGAPQNSP